MSTPLDWVSGQTYAIGQVVIRLSNVYECATGNSDVVFNPLNWLLIASVSVPASGLPGADDVRLLLEGFNITKSIISDAFINNAIINEVIPYVERFCRSSFTGIKQVVRLLSGTGHDTLMLDQKNIIPPLVDLRYVSGNDIDTVIQMDSIQLEPERGVIKIKSGLSEYYNYRIFPKGNDNIQVTYNYGNAAPPADIFQAITKLAAVLVLDNLSDRTGGGDLSTQGWSRTYSQGMGKYGNIRKRFSNQAHAILRHWHTGIIGN